jgi:hypothetical protein
MAAKLDAPIHEFEFDDFSFMEKVRRVTKSRNPCKMDRKRGRKASQYAGLHAANKKRAADAALEPNKRNKAEHLKFAILETSPSLHPELIRAGSQHTNGALPRAVDALAQSGAEKN